MAKINAILTRSIKNLGHAGEVVSIPPGFFNYLFRNHDALYATKENIDKLEKERQKLQAQDEERRIQAEALAQKLEGYALLLQREAGDNDILYGSASASDIVDALKQQGFEVKKSMVCLAEPFKKLGEYTVTLDLHPQVSTSICLHIQRHT